MDARGIPPYSALADLFKSEQKTLDFLISEDLLNIPTVCPQCGRDVYYRTNAKKVVRCGKKDCMAAHDGRRWSQSIMQGTFFQGCRLPLNEVLHFLYLFICGTTNQAIISHFHWSSKTVTDWVKFAQQLVGEMVLIQEDDYTIGGPGIQVQIDESKFGKRKYHRGHRVEGVWVFGGVEMTPERKCFLVKVPNRNKTTLRNLIKKFILPGSIIKSDSFTSYINNRTQESHIEAIPGYFYEHEPVNHSKNFVDPVTGCDTNMIEGTWNGVKRLVPPRKRTEAGVQTCLLEFMWRRQNDARLWEALLDALKYVRYEQ